MSNGRMSPRKMVRNKRDLKFSPNRNRPVTRVISRVGRTPSHSASTSCANVKVVVRVRPPNQRELGSNSRIMDRCFVTRDILCRTVVKISDNNIITFDPKEEDEPFFYHGVQQRGRDLLKKANKNMQFLFDRVFGYEADNSEVFTHSTKNLIPSLMDGYNCSVFVYGATGAGKTHTMLGQTDNPGITFLTMKELFHQIQEFTSEREFELAITYLEVYNETVKDLLNPGPPLHLREDGKFGVCVAGIKLHRISNPEELFALLAEGNGNRTQHPTDANAESSRSHAVFQVYVNMIFRGSGQRRIAKLSMIDLAGSERGAATGCSGARFTEGANINKSLLALGNCINSLADAQRHIPYRDSKLTRILKDSLGGNCQTVMIANVSPSSLNYEDTYNTLKYATRAKKIKSTMTKNVVNVTLTIPQYQKLVEDLSKENESLKTELDKIKKNKPDEPVSTCSSAETTSVKPEEQEVEAAWRMELLPLLKEKHNIVKQVQRLSHAEEILRCRIKFKEFSGAIIADCCMDEEQVEVGRNKIQTTVGSYQRQMNSVQAQIQDLMSQQRAIEARIQTLVDKDQIPLTDAHIIQGELQLQTDQLDLQKEHSSKLVKLCQAEIEQKEKIVVAMCDVINNYYQLMRANGHTTEQMAEDYMNILRMVRVRSVTWQDDNELLSAKSQDSGVSLQQTPTPSLQIPPFKSRPNSATPDRTLGSSAKRTTVKRKLYEIETKSNSAIDQFIKKHLTTDAVSKSTPNLNETITLTQPIDSDQINSTFCLLDKEVPVVPKKKTALSDRSNDILPKATMMKKSMLNGKSNVRNENNKFFTTSTRTQQRFPLRKNNADAGKDIK